MKWGEFVVYVDLWLQSQGAIDLGPELLILDTGMNPEIEDLRLTIDADGRLVIQPA